MNTLHVITVKPRMSLSSRNATKTVVVEYSNDRQWYPLTDGTGYWFYYRGPLLPLLTAFTNLYNAEIINGFEVSRYDG